MNLRRFARSFRAATGVCRRTPSTDPSEDGRATVGRARGVDRIMAPVGHTWDGFFLNGPKASDDFLVERA